MARCAESPSEFLLSVLRDETVNWGQNLTINFTNRQKLSPIYSCMGASKRNRAMPQLSKSFLSDNSNVHGAQSPVKNLSFTKRLDRRIYYAIVRDELHTRLLPARSFTGHTPRACPTSNPVWNPGSKQAKGGKEKCRFMSDSVDYSGLRIPKEFRIGSHR
jgi:hypothetical protein